MLDSSPGEDEFKGKGEPAEETRLGGQQGTMGGAARVALTRSAVEKRSVTCQGHLDQQVEGLHPDIQHPGAGEG